MGDPLFIKIDWFMQTAPTVKYYVEQCDVIQGSHRMSIVKQNCYARAVDATFLSGQSHLVSQTSAFSYGTFTYDAAKERSQTIECVLVFCVDGEECEILTDDAQCPRSQPTDYFFGFTLFGKA